MNKRDYVKTRRAYQEANCEYNCDYECKVLTEKVCLKKPCTFFKDKSSEAGTTKNAEHWVYVGERNKMKW